MQELDRLFNLSSERAFEALALSVFRRQAVQRTPV